MACFNCFSSRSSDCGPRKPEKNSFMPPIYLWIPNDGDNYLLYPEPGCILGEMDYFTWDTFQMDLKSAVAFLKTYSRGKVLFIRIEEDEQLITCLEILSRKWHYLETLHIECCDTVSPSCLKMIARYGISMLVKRIQCNGEVDAGQTVMEQLFRSCPNLESLHLASAPNLSVNSLNNLPPRLRLLFLQGTAFQTDTLEKFLNGKANQIKEFSIYVCDGEQLKMICSTMKDLVTLHIYLGGTDPPECLWSLAELKNLRHLYFGCINEGMEVELLTVLSNCSELKSLAVTSASVSPAFMQLLPRLLPQLEALCISDMENRSDKSSAGMQHLPALGTMARLNALCVRTQEEDVRPLIDLIEKSSSLRKLDLVYSCEEHTLLDVFHKFNNKASVNPKDQFLLRLLYSFQQLPTRSENLTVFAC